MERFLAVMGVVALTALLPGCGGGDGEGGGDDGTGTATGTVTQTGTISPTGSTGMPTGGDGPSVGSVQKILDPDAFIQGNEAFDDDPIRAGQSVSTDALGSVDFGLNQKLETCRLFPDSQVVASPASGILLRYERGTALCFTTQDQSIGVILGPSDVEFAMSDPLFEVSVDGGQSTLRVVQGVVDVRPSASGSGAPLLVGPGRQVTVEGGNVPAGTENFNTESLPQAEREAISEFEAAIPQPDFGPPDPDGSAGLQRILDANQIINVGIDARFIGDVEFPTADRDFADSFFVLLADHWGIRSLAEAFDPEDAAVALEAGSIDVFVTPEQLSGFGSLPLFGGLEGRTWSISFAAADELLGQALRTFIQATLQQRDYAITYSQAFGVDVPPYEPLRPLLGL